jgi:anti-sigma factor RsiW
MNACPDKAMLLQGLLDGELDAVNAAACEAHLKSCEGCEAEFRRLQALRETVAAPGVAHRAPERLKAGIEAMIAAEAAPEPRRRRVGSDAGYATVGALGGMAATGLAAALAVMLVLPQVTEAGVERQLVASHVRSLMANHLTDVATSNRHVVKPWFNGKADIAPPVPDLAAQGFPLVGGRLDYIDGHVAPAIVYSRRLHTVNLFVWPADGQVPGGTRVVRRDGYSLVEWAQGGLRFAAVSDIDPGELKEFEAAYVAHSPDAPH